MGVKEVCSLFRVALYLDTSRRREEVIQSSEVISTYSCSRLLLFLRGKPGERFNY
jgi:hypothetical protein